MDLKQIFQMVSDRMVQLGTQAQMETPGEVIAETKPATEESVDESIDKSE